MISKIELINKLQSLESKNVLKAVEDLRNCGMLGDGSLRGIALCQAVLQNADLKEADLCFVDLHQANLDNADLSHARLQAVKLNRASLQSANLEDADLTNAELYKVNLRGARNLTCGQFSSMNALFGSIMPDGAVYDGRFNLSGDLARARWATVDVDDPKSMAEFYGVTVDVYMQGQGKKTMVFAIA
jgi:uncharacterized protein YjbI with pentapeptide repeats